MKSTPLVYKYVAPADGPDRVGYAKPHVNKFGMTLVPSRLVPADFAEAENPDDRSSIDDRPAHVFTANQPFAVVENSELHLFVRAATQYFRKVPSSEFTVDGRGNVTAVSDPEKVVALPVERESHGIADQGDESAIFGSANNASWSAVEVTESAKLMRHAEHGGRRSGNSP